VDTVGESALAKLEAVRLSRRALPELCVEGGVRLALLRPRGARLRPGPSEGRSSTRARSESRDGSYTRYVSNLLSEERCTRRW
jgi:hypothetical protein